MEFRNLTPFPAMAFDALDQHDQRFHVVVMRLTFDVQDDGTLLLAPVQTPLATTDDYFGELNRSSVRQESDLAPYKPHTDVIVIADAHAPRGRATNAFFVGLKINGAPTEPALEGPVVLRKVLAIKGAREWRKRHVLTRALSIFMLPKWKLTSPQPLATLPLRYEYAYGGENKVLVTEQAARRVGKAYRLPGREPRTDNAGADGSPEAIAHTVCEQNPVGRGFAEDWHIRARKLERVPAPQIEAPSRPVGRLGAAYAPEGFGVVGRAWKPRLGLAGTYDRTWLDERHPNLPADFNFAYWNGAPADQQVTPHLDGDETVTLCNLCPAGAGTMRDATGNTLLSFALPGHLPFVLVRFQDGRIGELAARLDTVIIDAAPDAGNPDKKPSVVCVWRATVATEPGARVLEARMLTRTDVAALRSEPPRSAIV
jgi:hypothetical protein